MLDEERRLMIEGLVNAEKAFGENLVKKNRHCRGTKSSHGDGVFAEGV